MTLREKLIALAALAGLVAALVVGRMWIEEHDARVRAESVQQVQQTVMIDAQRQIASAREDAQRTGASLQAELDRLEAEKQKPVTPAQFVVDLNKLIPGLPAPAKVVQQKAASPAPGEHAASAAEAVEIPADDLQALQTYRVNCEETGARLGACQLTAVDTRAELEATQKQVAAEQAQAAAWKTAAKGGNFWHRLGKGAKCVALASGASALGAWAEKSNAAAGAAIGAAAGGIGCQVF